jgi:hypothetical protein
MLLLSPLTANSQQPAGSSRAHQIAALFTKHKDVVVVKRGVSREKYKDVRAEPQVMQNVSEYAGRYEASDLGWYIDIRVGKAGQIEVTGFEAGQPSPTFELENVTIAGALLTGRKVYRDGSVARFEGLFMNRTARSSRADTGVTAFGLGVVLARPVEAVGVTWDKLFYQLKQ